MSDSTSLTVKTYYDPQLETLLKTTRAADVLEIQPVIACRHDDTLPVALNALMKYKVLSLPVVDDENDVIGFVDWLDILAFVVTLDKEMTNFGYDEVMQHSKFTSKKVRDIVNLSGRDTIIKVASNASMWTLLNAMIDFGELHRVPVVTPTGEFKGLIAQSDVMAWIQPYLEENDLGLRTVRDFQLGVKNEVYSVSFKAPARDAFTLMKEKQVSAVAVLDSYNRLYGNMSATDLRVLGAETSFLSLLSLQVEKYMEFIPPNPVFGLNPIFARPTDTLRVIGRKFVDSGVHRLYVVQEGFELVGVISLTDIVRFLLACSTQTLAETSSQSGSSPR